MINSKKFDNIRVIAILSILLAHTVLDNVSHSKLSLNSFESISSFDFVQLLYRGAYLNLFKAATILFFIISGFLYQMQCHKFTDFKLFVRKKAKSLLLPYLVVFILPIVFLEMFIYPNIGIYRDEFTVYKLLVSICNEVIFGNYWFVLALFVILVVNFFIKTKNIISYLVLFIIVWGIAYLNVYFRFAMTIHSVWFPGFIFVFLVGRLIYLYRDELSAINLLQNKKYLLIICFLFYIVSNIESWLIFMYSKNIDHVNTLKIGNIGYGFFLFFLLNAILKNRNWVFMKSYNIYFIYLLHPVFINCSRYIQHSLGLDSFSYPTQFFYSIANFLFVLTSCLLLHRFFFSLKLNSKYLSSYLFKEK